MDCTECLFSFARKKSMPTHFYSKPVAPENSVVKTYKFLQGDPRLAKAPRDLWGTTGRYNLLTRHPRGGLSGFGDVHHPARVVFRVRVKLYFRTLKNSELNQYPFKFGKYTS